MALILLADDHSSTRDLLAERLTLDGHRVVAVGDAEGAYERFSTARPDLVIASIALPETEGKHLLARLRESARKVPLVVYDLGHRGSPRGTKAILSLGANAYLPDPTRHEALKGKISDLLTTKRKETVSTASGPEPRGRRAGPRPAVERAMKSEPGAARPKKKSSEREQEDAAEERVVARGELGPSTLPELLIDAWRQELTGVLRLSAKGGDSHAIRFEKGRPAGVSSSDPSLGLARWLELQGRLDTETADEIIEISNREGLSIAGALVSGGVVEAGPPLLELLSEYSRETMIAWFALRAGSYVLHEGEPSAREFGPVLDTGALSLVRDGARRHHRVSLWQKALGRALDGYPLRVSAFRTHFEAMELSPKEVTFAMRLGGEVSARDLLADSQAGFKQALLMLWFLHLIDAIEFSPTPKASEEAQIYQARAAKAGRKKKPLPPEKEDELAEEALRIVTASYFGVLGLDITADTEQVERAYYEIVTRFHPESFDEYELGGIEHLLQTVISRAAAAYRVLSIEEKRKEYLAFLLSRQETSARKGKIVADAEISLKKGLLHLEEGDTTSAAMAFEEAVRANPKEPAYLAHLAYAKFKSGHGPPDARAKPSMATIKKALQIEPDHEHTNLVAALIEIACGRRDKARAYALKVLRKNPKSQAGKALIQRINKV